MEPLPHLEKQSSKKSSKKDLNLKFYYNKNGVFLPQSKINKIIKGIASKETTINEIMNKPSEVNILVTKGRDTACSNSLNQTLDSQNTKNKQRNGVLSSYRQIRRKKEKLKRYKTFNVNHNGFSLEKSSNRATIKNLNINININKVKSPSNKNYFVMEDRILEGKNDNDDQSEINTKPVRRRKSEQMWVLIKNTFRTAKGFTKHEVKKIMKESELQNEIENYKILKGLSPHTKNSRIRPYISNFMEKTEIEKEFIRAHLKESVYKIILDGNVENSKLKLDEIFLKNEERYIYDNNHPNFLFNQPLYDSKKTLIYIACQEGNYEVVQYFLDKNLNTSIKSRSDHNEYETCLDVAARWNYTTIVKLLLEKGNISEMDVRETLKKKWVNPTIVKVLNKYLENKTGKTRKGCACF